MFKKLRSSAYLILISGFIWLVATVAFFLIRYWKQDGFGLSELRFDLAYQDYPIVAVLITSFLFGVLSEFLEVTFFREKLRGLSNPSIFLFKIVFYIVSLSAIFIGILAIEGWMERGTLDGTLDPLRNISQRGLQFPILLNLAGIVLFTSLYRQLYRIVGPLNFLDFALGRYNEAREEERIFLFIDLNDSTTHAEKLGHKKYSRLLQECFNDLSGVAFEFRAQNYQFVGDEVVFTWRKKSGFRAERCFKLFFHYRALLLRKQSIYLKKYGVVPTFKAGMHVGPAIGATVGYIKTQIAFHGDAINTTARILGKCHDLDEDFLVSENIVREAFFKRFKVVEKGSFPLRGKEEQLKLYGVRRA